jgi:hypothetical protein
VETSTANAHRFHGVTTPTGNNVTHPTEMMNTSGENSTETEHHGDNDGNDTSNSDDDTNLDELCPGMDPRHPLASIHGNTAHDYNDCLEYTSKTSEYEDDIIESYDASAFCAFCLTEVTDDDVYDHFPKFFTLDCGDGICYADLDHTGKSHVNYVGCSGKWCFKRQRLMKLWTAKFGNSVVPIQQLQRQHRDRQGRRTTK